MSDSVMNTSLFRQRLEQLVGRYTTEWRDGNNRVYRILQGLQPWATGMEFSITDRGIEGISILFYDAAAQNMRRIDHIYHWSEAYELLLRGLLEPQSIRYLGAAGLTVDIPGTLGEHICCFEWDQENELLTLSDQTLNWALELVKYGYIRRVDLSPEGDVVQIFDRMSICGQGTDEQWRNEVRQRWTEGFDDQSGWDHRLNWGYSASITCWCNEVKCQHSACLWAICGYLEYAASRGCLHLILGRRAEQRARNRMACGPYSFSWTFGTELASISDTVFHLSSLLADWGAVRVEPELKDGQMVCMNCSTCACRGELAAGWEELEFTAPFLAHFAFCNQGVSGLPSFSWQRNVDRASSSAFNSPDCRKCHFTGSCPVNLAGYIRYLQDCGREAEIGAARDWYHSHRAQLTPERAAFGFTLSEELMMDTPEETFELAELLQAHGCVALQLAAEGQQVRVVYVGSAEQMTGPGQLKQAIRERAVDYGELKSCLCDLQLQGQDCGKHILLAAYIDYLRRTGRYEDYRRRVAEHRRMAEESFRSAKQELPALDKVLAIADNRQESSLYCVIQGERGAGKRDIVRQIARLLAQKGKIDDPNYQCLTFLDLAARLTHQALHPFGENTLSYYYQVYDELESRKLYVLTDLKEFLHSCQSCTDGDDTPVSHLVKLLGRFRPQTYIIVIGEKKYTERFVALSPNIKFLFGSNIITCENLAPEQLYRQFCSKLSEELQSRLAEEPRFRSRFLDYIALNRKLMPLGNQELAEYLAEYANIRKDLELPPDVYRKQSARELLKTVVGMENVKRAVNEFEQYALFMKRAELNGMKLPNSNLHMIFTGNPGTGKTMIARIIAQMLFDFGIIAENKLLEVESKDLVAGYVGQTAIKTGEIIDKALNGVLFVDEAYSLSSGGSSRFGEEAIATLIKAMEDHRDKLVVIFAGYEKEMREFVNINPGISSRIGYTFHFDDYTAQELVRIFDIKMTAAGFTYGPEVLDRVDALCRHFVQRRNFGNGRFVDKVMQRVIFRHASSPERSEEVAAIACEDVPTVEEFSSTDVVEHKDFETQLSRFIGMDSVKNKVRQFARYMEFCQAARTAGARIPAENMHMIFTGNPGTGKTTIARVMVDLLYDIGIIQENKLVEVERKDLVAEYMGQTSQKTAEVIEEAMGGILFVDEAYTLAPKGVSGDFGAEAVATLIKAMEDHKGELIVIFAGYREEMRQFLELNPGIASRIGNTFDFPDYTPGELKEMYRLRLEKAGFTVTEEALKRLEVLLEYFVRKKNFGNGRFVTRLQQESLMLHSTHVLPDRSNLLEIGEDDIPLIADLNNAPRSKSSSVELDSIIGMEEVKEQVRRLENTVRFTATAREHGLTVPAASLHMIFTGNPGTGKTTIARIIAKKLYDIGVIQENKLVEVERKDLVAGYIGQTAMKTAEIIDQAMGGILFVDEAYTLTPQDPKDFGSEAIATLIKAMEDHKEDLVVILAGYREEMAQFEDSNPGIASRVGLHLHFPDYSAGELTEIFLRKLRGNGFDITPEAVERVRALMERFSGVRNFGNGRFVDRVLQNTLSLHAGQYRPEAMGVIDAGDIPDGEAIAGTMGSQANRPQRCGF